MGSAIGFECIDPYGSYYKFNLDHINLYNLIRSQLCLANVVGGHASGCSAANAAGVETIWRFLLFLLRGVCIPVYRLSGCTLDVECPALVNCNKDYRLAADKLFKTSAHVYYRFVLKP